MVGDSHSSFSFMHYEICTCLLYTSDAADERSSVDLGGRRIIKKKKSKYIVRVSHLQKAEIPLLTNKY